MELDQEEILSLYQSYLEEFLESSQLGARLFIRTPGHFELDMLAPYLMDLQPLETGPKDLFVAEDFSQLVLSIKKLSRNLFSATLFQGVRSRQQVNLEVGILSGDQTPILIQKEIAEHIKKVGAVLKEQDLLIRSTKEAFVKAAQELERLQKSLALPVDWEGRKAYKLLGDVKSNLALRVDIPFWVDSSRGVFHISITLKEGRARASMDIKPLSTPSLVLEFLRALDVGTIVWPLLEAFTEEDKKGRSYTFTYFSKEDGLELFKAAPACQGWEVRLASVPVVKLELLVKKLKEIREREYGMPKISN